MSGAGCFRHALIVVENAVNAVSDSYSAAVGFDVDVTRAVPDGLKDYSVCDADNKLFVNLGHRFNVFVTCVFAGAVGGDRWLSDETSEDDSPIECPGEPETVIADAR